MSNFNTKEHRKEFPCKYLLYDIRKRCANPNCFDYKWYGGRGIKCLITEQELEFLWLRDNAHLMQKPSIDRKDKTKGYTFDNCQFIEHSINAGKDKYKKVL